MPHHPTLPKAPLPTREIFDPFNSSSTGHQTAPSRLSGSTSWRESRSLKLAKQLKDISGRGGANYVSDLVGAGSENWRKDGRKDNGDWEPGAPGLREKGWQDIRSLMSSNKKRPREEVENEKVVAIKKTRVALQDNSTYSFKIESVMNKNVRATISIKGRSSQEEPADTIDHPSSPSFKPPPPQIFRGLTIYLNGSTAPEVSDHKLKQIFMQHGGNSSIALGRRTVTHVILGKTCGGGLASGKIHKEVTTVSGKGIKYVTVHWVLDSVAKGIRQPECQYVPKEIAKRIGGSGQIGVRNLFAMKAVSDQGG